MVQIIVAGVTTFSWNKSPCNYIISLCKGTHSMQLLLQNIVSYKGMHPQDKTEHE